LLLFAVTTNAVLHEQRANRLLESPRVGNGSLVCHHKDLPFRQQETAGESCYRKSDAHDRCGIRDYT